MSLYNQDRIDIKKCIFYMNEQIDIMAHMNSQEDLWCNKCFYSPDMTMK